MLSPVNSRDPGAGATRAGSQRRQLTAYPAYEDSRGRRWTNNANASGGSPGTLVAMASPSGAPLFQFPLFGDTIFLLGIMHDACYEHRL
jgi:hypothetical protein